MQPKLLSIDANQENILGTLTKQSLADYARIKKAIEFIGAHVSMQPSLEDIAGHLNLSPFHCQRLFSRWAGLTPKQFLQILTLEHAKRLLADAAPLMDTSHQIGLSGSSRLHDHFVTIEAATPGEFKYQGKGMEIRYGQLDTPFGRAFFAATDRGICHLAFTDQTGIGTALAELKAQWPLAKFLSDGQEYQGLIQSLFYRDKEIPARIPLHISGTNFQVNVWRALLRIPESATVSYSDIAETIGSPRAVRAVGTAIGANPVGFLIPCHRVLRQSGALGGYRWGLTRKQAMLAWEASGHA